MSSGEYDHRSPDNKRHLGTVQDTDKKGLQRSQFLLPPDNG